MSTAGDAPALVRQIGVRGLALTVVNLIVGIGIFGLPGLLAAAMGPGAVLAYLTCAVVTAFIALCMVEAVSRVPEPGGLMASAGAAFGPVAASVVGNLLWFSTGSLAVSAIAVLALNALAAFVPTLADGPGRLLALAAIFAGLAWINIRGGVRAVLGVTGVVSVLKFIPLVLLIVVGLPRVEAAHLRLDTLPTAGELASGTILLFFAFLGGETAMSTSGEVVRPERTIPLGFGLGLGLVGLLYFGLQIAGQGVLGPALAQEPDAPLVALGRVLFGPAGATLILLTTVASAFGVLMADAFATPRALYGLGRRGLLPRAIAQVHPGTHTPHVAVLAYCGVNFLLASTGTFRQLALFAAGGTLAMHLVTAASVLKLRRDPLVRERPGYRIPGGPVVPVATLLLIAGLLQTLTRAELGALVLLCGVAALPALRRTGRAAPLY